MKIKNKKIVFFLVGMGVFLVGVGFFVSSTNAALAQAAGVYIPTKGETGLSDNNLKDIIMTFMKWLLSLVGVIAVIGFAVSGIQYMLSTGDDKMIEKAKKNMTYSIVGVIVALSALVIITAVNALLWGSASF